jgi:peptide deformylase
MAVLDVKKYDEKVLHKPAKSIRKVTDDLRQLAQDMAETMDAANGVGLAANQVGVPKRLIVVAIDEDVFAFINPRIVMRSAEKISSEEGCLSFPRLYGVVKRHATVKVATYDLEMKLHKFECEGMVARIFQHEIDHLDGITFTERAEKGTLHEVEPREETDQPEAEGEGDPAAAAAGGGQAE